MGAFKEPHGGELKELYLTESNAEHEKLAAADYSSWNLTDRQLCDIELLLNGAFSPLDGFLSRAEYDSVLAKMRLPSGLVWPIPINARRHARVRSQRQGRRPHRACAIPKAC